MFSLNMGDWGTLPHVIPLAVHLDSFSTEQVRVSFYVFFSCKDTAQHLHLVCLSVRPSVVKPEIFSVSSLLGQVYTKPVYCTNVHKISLLCKCTQNPFTVHVYTKPAYC